MKKKELEQKTEAVIVDTREVLQYILGLLNQGQRKKIQKDEKAAKIFERHGVRV